MNISDINILVAWRVVYGNHPLGEKEVCSPVSIIYHDAFNINVNFFRELLTSMAIFRIVSYRDLL